MSEIITASNLDQVIQKNNEIRAEVSALAMKLQSNPSFLKVNSMPQLAFLILYSFGLVQMPVDDKYWSGAIFVKNGKLIPVINTALPRANQYFAAWHEIYHLLFDEVLIDHVIENENIMDERKAECFAANMLLQGVENYFVELVEIDFISKILCCMSAFQAPYKAVLVSLYEYAVRSDKANLQRQIKEVFDVRIENIAERFQKLGLDDSLVLPSYVVNTSYLRQQIAKSVNDNSELKYHTDNEKFLDGIMNEIRMIVEKSK